MILFGFSPARSAAVVSVGPPQLVVSPAAGGVTALLVGLAGTSADVATNASQRDWGLRRVAVRDVVQTFCSAYKAQLLPSSTPHPGGGFEERLSFPTSNGTLFVDGKTGLGLEVVSRAEVKEALDATEEFWTTVERDSPARFVPVFRKGVQELYAPIRRVIKQDNFSLEKINTDPHLSQALDSVISAEAKLRRENHGKAETPAGRWLVRAEHKCVSAKRGQ